MNTNLVWYTGAPGSKWSGTANILQSIAELNFNLTDRSPEREYRHSGPTELARGITHTGVYFGPGHGFGEDWDNFTNLDPEHIEAQVVKEWTDSSNGRLLVKSHFLSHHLDSVAERWPNNPIMMVFRPNDRCAEGWFGAGGWDIAYPDYRPYYKNDQRMLEVIAEHNQYMLEFCNKHNLTLHAMDEEFLYNTFNWTVEQIPDPEYRAWVHKHLIHTKSLNDVKIAIYNLDKLYAT